MKSPVSTVVAIAVGFIALLGYFLAGFVPALAGVQSTLIGWAVILAAIATLVGVVNLLSVHANKVNNQERGMVYSLILIVAFVLTLVAGLWDAFMGGDVSYLSLVVRAVQIPVESSLMALLAVILILAGFRLLRRRQGLAAWVFFGSALLYLLVGSGLLLTFGPPLFSDAIQSLPVAGTRGILIGIGLGSLVTGLRVLIGADKPYGG